MVQKYVVTKYETTVQRVKTKLMYLLVFTSWQIQQFGT